MKKPSPVASVFSPFVIDALVRAARTPETTPITRVRAVEAAIRYAKQQHPDLFKKDAS
jgi:hypothetical protein